MGADWIKFRVREDADAAEVRDLAAFVSEQYPHGRWIVTPSPFSDDERTRGRWRKALERLEDLLVFPRGRLDAVDYWDYTTLTDPPGSTVEVVFEGRPRVVPSVDDLDKCRVYVISCNPVFPIEWRDEAHRIILPTELPAYYDKWRTHIAEVRAGLWQQYLHELYLFDRVRDEHQYEQFEDLAWSANESLTRANAWCHKERLAPIRDRILQFNAVGSLQAMRAAITWPRFDESIRAVAVTTEQLQKEAEYWELRRRGTAQIMEWNGLVPQNWKLQFPSKVTYEDFIARAECSWLKGFFAWCEYLIDRGNGLFLWA
jgi:hypothetical protein